MTPATLLLLVHAGATLFMTGLIWFVQIVHYPLFAHVGVAEFARYEQLHSFRTTLVVMPVMLIELAAAAALVALPTPAPRWMVFTGAALIAAIWLSTFLLSVPRHTELAAGFLPEAHRQLVLTNWIRTLAWTVRAVLALWMLARPARLI